MQCPSCGTIQPEKNIICESCSAILALSDDDLDRIERFRLLTHTEILCMLFCDISGYSRISERSLTESERVLAVYLALAQQILEKDGAGQIVDTAGDGVLVVFSNPATALERTLALQAAIHKFYAQRQRLHDHDLVQVLRAQGVNLDLLPQDDPFEIHAGLHLGLVTRGGRTSRDVVGHNVNVASRVCNLARAGQIYMTEPVYDNARLVMEKNESLQWQTWKDIPIRGIAAPLTVIGVAQHPYSELLPPTGIPLINVASNLFRSLSLRIALGAVALFIVGLIILVARWPHLTSSPQPLPISSPAEPSTALTKATEQPLPPIVATVNDPVEPETHLTPTPPPTAETNVKSSSTVTTTDLHTAAVTTETPPAAAPGTPPAATPAETAAVANDPELNSHLSTLLKPGTPIHLGDGQGAIDGTFTALREKSGLLIAVGVEEQAGEKADLTLIIDSKHDGKLNSEKTAPYHDILLGASGPAAEKHSTRYLSLCNGKAGDPLPANPGVVARAIPCEQRTVWIFRIPHSELGAASGSVARFQVQYRPKGNEGRTWYHPPDPEGAKFRDIVIP